MTNEIFEILAFLLFIFLLLYYYVTSTFNHWKIRGVKGPKAIPFFGNTKDVILGRTSMAEYVLKLYAEYEDEPVLGIFDKHVPLLMIKDADHIKDVLIKDFSKFSDRVFPPNPKVEPLSQHLFRLDTAKWRRLRTKLSPVFTSGKLKEMFHLLLKCSKHFEGYLDSLVAKNEPIDCQELTAKFTTDVIGSCAFGLEMNAMSNDESEFRKVGRNIFKDSVKNFLKERIMNMPLVFKVFSYFIGNKDVERFLTRVIKETIEYRIRNNVCRHDFVDILIELKQHPEKLGEDELSDEFIASQGFVFFAGGFETSAITITFMLFELALNQSMQDKLRKEIHDAYRSANQTFEYESIIGMKYLHAIFQESLRKYPPGSFLLRKAVEDYTFEKSKITISEGEKIIIPVYTIQHDPNIYPDPEVFDPDRFLDGNAEHRNPMHYLPFGGGPRSCIAARFAALQVKMGIIAILLNYKVDISEKTRMPVSINPVRYFLLQPQHTIYLKLTKLIDESVISNLQKE